MDVEFELVGILIGLAIYNSHILDFSFPRVLYKRLMGLPVELADLRELQPEVWGVWARRGGVEAVGALQAPHGPAG
eukprot:263147-Chlamydomonas_euryale.AAC.2